MNKLLEKQIRNYLTPECLENEHFARFIEAVGNSYDSYERDRVLSAHAFTISEEEYATVNDRLRVEVELKKAGIRSLKKAIRSIDSTSEHFPAEGGEEDNLMETLSYLDVQIAKWKKGEIELQRLSLVARANENGVLFTNAEGVISWANEGFSRLTGYSMEEIVGKTPLGLCKGPLSDRNELRKMMEAFNSGKSFNIEIKHYRKNGSWFWGKAKGQSIIDEKGNISRCSAMVEDITSQLVGSIGIHLDITDQKKLEIDLIEAKEQAEESSMAKETFLANMSHEIRTPINAILGMSRELKKTDLTHSQKLYLDTISAATDNLLVVINDILDISKIEAGKLTIECIGFAMKQLLLRTTSVMLHKAEEKGLQLGFWMDERIPAVMLGDPYRLNQVLLNLISNAIKFTNNGSVMVRCEILDRPERCNVEDIGPAISMIRIAVKDTGIGMERQFLDNLFQKFSQEDISVARKYGGSGLGMSICKQLVGLMKGVIRVESIKGAGTEISIDIPFAEGSNQDLKEEDEEGLDPSILKGSRILLAEDNEMNRLVATTILKGYGVGTFEAINGAEAVKSLIADHFDLVLMDMQMPVMDGLEATRRIRSDINKAIPIIALTANAIKGESDRCLQAGMNDYISKPFEEKFLIGRIAYWLTKRRSHTTEDQKFAIYPTRQIVNPDPQAHITQSTANEHLYDLRQLEEIGHYDNNFTQKMIDLFLEQIPVSVREMKSACQLADFATIRKIAHRIKPVLQCMNIHCLESEILEMEKSGAGNTSLQRLQQLVNHLEQTITKVADDLIALPRLAEKRTD